MEGQIKRKRLDIVDFLRGFSIFTIVLMHLVQCYPLPGFLMKASSMGGAGVHVFILCSGFGLYLSSLYNPMKYGRFLKRRFTKVYIPYVLVVLISALYFGLVCGQDVLMPLLGSVFLFKMFVPSLECAFGGQMWFVSTIIQFYLFYPLIVKMLEKKKGISLLISLCWATFTALTGLAEERIWNSFFLQYLWEFVLGMWLAKVYFENSENIKVPKVSVLLVTLKSATKLFSVLLASKRPLITELADKLRLKYPLLPTISPCPTMRLEAIRSIIPISCRRYPKSV